MSISQEIQRAAKAIRDKGSFFLCAHEHPDGDALGSMLSLACVLKDMGKRVVVHAPEPAPRAWRFLPGIEWLRPEPGPEQSEAAIVIDCGSLPRVGPRANELAHHPLVINIDHHQTGGGFGHLLLVDPTSPAAGEIVRRLIAAIPRPLTYEVALNLYVAVASDTGNFQNANTGPRAFELAAELAGHGVRADEVARYLFDDFTLARLKLLGLALGGLETHEGGRLAVLSISRRMLAEAGAGMEDCAGLINNAASLSGVKVAVMLTEMDKRVDVSLRSRDGVNVADVAERFGGGGHPNASGFTLPAGLGEARRRVVEALGRALGEAEAAS